MALTANRELNRYVDQELRAYPVAADAHVFKGAFVGVDRATGRVRNLQAGDLFAGIAYEEADNTGGAGGAISVRVYTQGDFILPVVSAAQAMVGFSVYAVDNEDATVVPAKGASLVGVLMAVIGTETGIVRILPQGGQAIEHSVTMPLAGSTSAAITQPVMIPQRAIRVVSIEVSFLTVPNQGNLDVGTTLADPDELINAFNLATLSPNTPVAPSLAGRDVAAGLPILAKVGQASTTAAAGGMLTMRFVELP